VTSIASEAGPVGVVGLGTMGAGIVEVLARGGLNVLGVEANEQACLLGQGHLRRSTDRAVSRGRLSAPAQAELLGRVRFTTALEDLSAVSLVIEAVPEREALKAELFTRLDAICRPAAVIATKTSSLSVTRLASGTRRPERVLGLHFFNPAPVMRLVEVVSTVATDPAVLDEATGLVSRLGKTAVSVRDRAGFVVNALLFGYLAAAVRLLETSGATREDIDTAMTAGAGLPMGPFTLLDLIGLDSAESILQAMYDDSGSSLLVPPRSLRDLVALGRLGRKAGAGFYRYEAAGSPVSTDLASPLPPLDAARALGSLAVAGPGADPSSDTTAAVLVSRARTAGLEVGGEDAVAAADVVVVPPGPAPGPGGSTGGAPERDAARRLLAQVGSSARPDAVLIVSDPLASVAEAGAAAGRPADVVGLHVVGLHAGSEGTGSEGSGSKGAGSGGAGSGGAGSGVAEIAPSVATSPSAMATALALADRLGLRPVR